MKPTRQSRLVTVSAAAGVVGPILFGIIVISLGYLWTGYNPLTNTISELEATNAPNMELQALNFAILGILTIIFAIGLGIHNRRFRSTSVLIGIYGVGTLLVAVLPCDPGCSFKGTSLVQIAHSLDALISFIVLAIAPLFFWRSSKTVPSWTKTSVWSLRVAVGSISLLGAFLVITVLSLSPYGVASENFSGIALRLDDYDSLQNGQTVADQLRQSFSMTKPLMTPRHERPFELLSMTAKSRTVEFRAEGGPGKGYLASPEKPRGGVLVLHAWWGLNDFFKGFCNRLASQGFLALAPDLHDGAVARSVGEAKELHSKVDEGRIKRIVLGAADYLRSDPSVSGRKIGAVGFSMGAAWSLLLSTLKPESVGAVVVFYGTYPIDFSKAEASYLGHFVPDDEWEP